MSVRRRVLIAGESWVTHSIHQKGFDSFTTTSYSEGVRWLRAALEAGGFAVDFLPNHLAPTAFPTSMPELQRYGAVVLSDIGTNTLLLHPDTFERSMPIPNRLTLLRQYVSEGGGLVMVGGYMTFQGIEGRARYGGTAVEEALPVRMAAGDDRLELPEGGRPVVRAAKHPIVAGLPGEWPALLGYNRVSCKEAAELVVEINGDPLLVVWEYGRGRSAAFTSDCGPHWCPPGFTDWPGYARLWPQLASWLTEGPRAIER
jgi:uncharacterized membrane protein